MTRWEYKIMKIGTKLTIPKNKVEGERMGQLIYNAIRRGYDRVLLNDEIGDKLFYIENDKLQNMINKYLDKKS